MSLLSKIAESRRIDLNPPPGVDPYDHAWRQFVKYHKRTPKNKEEVLKWHRAVWLNNGLPPVAASNYKPTSQPFTYTIQSGDTLEGIGSRYGVDASRINRIIAANPGIDRIVGYRWDEKQQKEVPIRAYERLKIGSTINMPDSDRDSVIRRTGFDPETEFRFTNETLGKMMYNEVRGLTDAEVASRFNGPAIGPWQIEKPTFLDMQKRNPAFKNLRWEDMGNPKHARAFVDYYGNHLAREFQYKYGRQATQDDVMAMWNKGLRGAFDPNFTKGDPNYMTRQYSTDPSEFVNQLNRLNGISDEWNKRFPNGYQAYLDNLNKRRAK